MPYKFNPFTGNLDLEGPILTGTGTVSAADDGTAALPGITFASDLNTGIYRPGADQLALTTNGTERMRITSDGYARLASGSSGIQFGGDTAAANALDDYEEGNWTPGNLDPDFSIAVARYIKIGRLVHAWFVTINSNTTNTYDLPNSVTGLPYVRRMTNPYANYGLLAGTVSVINTITYSGSQIAWNGVVTGKFNDADGCNIRWKNDTTESSPNLRPQIVNAPTGGLYFDFHVVYEALS